jgi:hypothetical protein
MTKNTDWIEWHGGECPVEPGTMVAIRLRDGDEFDCLSNYLRWYHKGYETDIIAYCIVSEPETPQPNPVTSPAHYTAGEIECIDAIRAALTPEEFRGFCKGNVIKYTWRERHKGQDESLAKAVWYLERLVK